MSTLLTIFAIRQILRTLDLLRFSHTKIDTNKRVLILHIIVLISNLIAIIVCCVPTEILAKNNWIIPSDLLLLGTDSLV